LFKYELTKQRTWEARAAAAAARAAELAPDSPDTQLALGDLHRVAGRFAEAIAEYEQVQELRPGDYEARFGRAWALNSMNRHEDAIVECERAIAQRPADWRAHSLLGYLHASRGSYPIAIAAWRRVVELVPDHAKAAVNLGSVLFHLDRFEEAIDQLERAIAIQPNAVAYTNLGTVLFFAERYGEAADAFEKSVALLPSDPIKWGNLGNASRFIPGHQARATQALERAVGLMREGLERNPGEAEAWGRLAGWLANLGRGAEAEQAIAEALRLAPNDVHCMVYALHVHWQVGHRAEALHWIREALRHGYGARALLRSPDLAGLRDDREFQSMLSELPESPGSQTPGPEGRKEIR
jgi:tetratricopeptide (TPR) repeat protein